MIRTFITFGAAVLISNYFTANAQESGYYRIQAELLQLQNPLGIRHDGALCDNFGTCDPVIKVFLDTTRPQAAFPGARYISQYQKIFIAVDQNEPLINKIVTEDVCGHPFTQANLRAYVKDDDSFLRLTDDHISDFDCLFAPTPDVPIGSVESTAQWSKGQPCVGTTQPGRIKLFFRYRMFQIPAEECGKLSLTTDAPSVAPVTSAGVTVVSATVRYVMA